MFDLDNEDMYFPNTETMRNYLESLNYTLKPINYREHRDPVECKSICFGEWVVHFGAVKESNTLLYCMDEPNLTEEQSIFALNILQVCPDYKTFEKALQQYINSNP